MGLKSFLFSFSSIYHTSESVTHSSEHCIKRYKREASITCGSNYNMTAGSVIRPANQLSYFCTSCVQ